MTRRWLGRRLLGCLVAGTLLLASMSLARAASTPAPQPGPPPPEQGIESLVPPPPHIQQGNQPTLAERYSVQAYVPFPISPGDAVGQAVFDVPEETANLLCNAWAGMVMTLLLVLGILTGRLVEWTFSMDVVSGADGPLTSVVRALADQVYAPLLTTVLALVGVWLMWQLLVRRRTLVGLQGAAWALTALVAAGVYFAAPVEVMSGVNEATAGLSQDVLGAISSGDPAMASRASDPSFAQGDAGDAELRMFVDRYWRTFVFTPWSVAALGDVSTGQRFGEELLAKYGGGSSSFDSDFQANASQSAREWYGGSKSGTWRLAIVSIALLVAMLASLLFLLVAGVVVVAQLALLALLMAAPLFLLVGVHPGVGRRLLVRWAEMVAGVLLLRVLSAAFLAVILVLSSLVTTVATSSLAGWGVGAALQVALLIAAFVYRKPFLRVFGQVAHPRLVSHHVSHPRVAQALHGFVERRTVAMRRRAQQAAASRGPLAAASAARGAAAAAGGAATAASGAPAATRTAAAAAGTGLRARLAARLTGPGLALTALEAGALGVRTMARGTRLLQDRTSPFVLHGGGARPPQPTFARSGGSRALVASGPARPSGQGSRPAPAAEGQAEASTSDRGRRGQSRQRRTEGGERQGSGGRTYTSWRTGETVTMRSSRIILPGGWQQVRRP
jgi:hypothetical protein